MEALVVKQEEKTDGRISVVYIIRNGSTVKCAEVMLPARTDPDTYGADNASTLYNSPTAKGSTLGVFNGVKEKPYREIHMGAIFAGYNQFALGGDIAEVLAMINLAYQQDDTKLAEMQAFDAMYKAGTDMERKSLQSRAIFAIIGLLGSQ